MEKEKRYSAMPLFDEQTQYVTETYVEYDEYIDVTYAVHELSSDDSEVVEEVVAEQVIQKAWVDTIESVKDVEITSLKERQTTLDEKNVDLNTQLIDLWEVLIESGVI